VYSVELYDCGLTHGNYRTYYLCSENVMQIKQYLWTMERAFLGQETFTVSQVHMYYKPSPLIASKFFCRSELFVIFDCWTDKLKNKDYVYIHVIMPNNRFFPYPKHFSFILSFVKTYIKQYCDTKWADTRKWTEIF